MREEVRSAHRYQDTPSDKPQPERAEHANLERPGAQAHPKASGWRTGDYAAAWRRG